MLGLHGEQYIKEAGRVVIDPALQKLMSQITERLRVSRIGLQQLKINFGRLLFFPSI